MNEIKKIIEALRNGINPVTGDFFETSILSDDPEISREIIKLAIGTQESVTFKKSDSTNEFHRDSNAIFEELRRWRLDTAIMLGLPAYYVFSNNELWAIAEGDIVDKSDLLLIKGISKVKFEEYGDDLFELLKPFIDEDLEPREYALKNSDAKSLCRHSKPLPILSDNQLHNLTLFTDEPVYISDIAKGLSNLRNKSRERAIKYKDIADWLAVNGYISQYVNDNGKVVRESTTQGIEMGIITETREGHNGLYNVLRCDVNAQRFIIDNYNRIVKGEPPKMADSVSEKMAVEFKTKETNDERKVTCSKCMLYRNETCFGEKNICKDFKNAVDISEEERKKWPTAMQGPYGTLHKDWD